MSSYDQDDRHHNAKRLASQKYMKIILLLIAVAIFQWFLRKDLSDHQDYAHEQIKPEPAATILLIHYHKTGNNFVMDLLKEIHRTYDLHKVSMKEPSVLERMNKKKGNNRGHLQRGQEKHFQKMIGRDDTDDDAFGDESIENAINKTHKHLENGGNNTMMLPRKRSHDRTTGCPILGDVEYETRAAYRMQAPNFFCNLSMPVKKVMLQAKTKVPSETDRHISAHDRIRARNLPFPAWEATKIIHFVRDPFDMALSTYLYHSQYPTPEPWIKRRDINPCNADDQFMKLVLDKVNGVKYPPSGLLRSNISKEDLLKVNVMCQDYKVEHRIAKSKPNNKTRSFYGILRRLPPYDGLRFATSHFLMAQNVQSGGDLLRMANNILRLQKWDATGCSTAEFRRRPHVLTIKMGDLVEDMKGNMSDIK